MIRSQRKNRSRMDDHQLHSRMLLLFDQARRCINSCQQANDPLPFFQ